MQRVLILSCSQRKRPDRGLLPAIERYDGPPFRVLRKYLRQGPSDPPDTYILSAEFGLIPAARPIPDYERRMTPQRATDLQTPVAEVLSLIFDQIPSVGDPSRQLFINLGKDYLPALGGFGGPAAGALIERNNQGTQGVKLAHLHDWLYGAPQRFPQPPQPPALIRPQHIRGVQVATSGRDALARTRQALSSPTAPVPPCQVWCVMVDGQAVPPKWMVSVLTGLPVGRFTTGQARAALDRLGIAVQRA